MVPDGPATEAMLFSRDEHVIPLTSLLVIDEEAHDQVTTQQDPIMDGAHEHTPSQGLLDLPLLCEKVTARRYDQREAIPTGNGASVGLFGLSEDHSAPSMQTRPIDTDLHCDKRDFLANSSSDLKWALILLLSDGCLTVLGNTKLDMI